MAEHPKKIDVHSHFLPPFYRQALLDEGYLEPDGMPSGVPEWSAEAHLKFMDEVNIGKSIISISSPGTDLTSSNVATFTLTRDTNNFAADLKRQYPDRFGFFASVPLPDVEASIEEVKYAFDELNADGIVLHSNTAGIYLGDPVLRPLLAELDKRHAVVFVHPTSPCMGHTHCSPEQRYLASAPLAKHYPAPLFEFFYDSGRSFLDLINTGTILRFPNIKWVATHCGGVLPSLIDRVIMALRFGVRLTESRDAIDIDEAYMLKVLKNNFWFDLAGDPIAHMINDLLHFVEKDQLLFGSDVPWTPIPKAVDLVHTMEGSLGGVVGDEWVPRIWSSNAEELFGWKARNRRQ